MVTLFLHIINYNSIIGNNILNSSLIEHDVKIGNNNHISTGAIINGNVQLEIILLEVAQ